MRAIWLALPFLALGCGARTGLGVPEQLPDASIPDDGGCGPPTGGCTGIACNIPQCDAGAHTTISGTVYDPGGNRSLPGIIVYVPNGPLDPIPPGVACTQCQAPASGHPIISTLTDAQGHFTLGDVPAGSNIPLVIQVGKWRRQITVASVSACRDNAQADRTVRLPKNHSEGDIPLIAVTTGCDKAECFLIGTVGLDPGEFTAPSGGGRVHVYRGHDNGQGLPAGIPPSSLGAYSALWSSLSTMKQYDMLFDACECSTYERGTDAYANMEKYLDGGGRLFSTHYQYNFFADTMQCAATTDASCRGPADFAGVAQWQVFATLDGPYQIDTTLPKGKILADWYAGVTKGTPFASNYGELKLVDTRQDVHQVTKGQATAWIRIGAPDNYNAYYLSFNTPVRAAVTSQCGKAVFSDIHLTGHAPQEAEPWPSSCDGLPDDHTPNQLAQEYLFFDLASCVQDETQPPVVPCH